jgi:hypothetical protein
VPHLHFDFELVTKGKKSSGNKTNAWVSHSPSLCLYCSSFEDKIAQLDLVHIGVAFC